MTAKPKFCLLDDWRRVLRRAWSIRFSLLAAAFTARTLASQQQALSVAHEARLQGFAQVIGNGRGLIHRASALLVHLSATGLFVGQHLEDSASRNIGAEER